MAGAISGERSGPQPGARHRAPAGPGRRHRQPHAADQFRLDGARPAGPHSCRPGSGAALGLELGFDRGRAQRRDVGRRRHAGARWHLSGRRRDAGNRRATRFSDDAAQLAVPAAERPDRPARAVRDARFRSGVSADLAARQSPDFDHTGGRHTRSIAGRRGRGARSRDREIRRKPAGELITSRSAAPSRKARSPKPRFLRCCP